MRHVLVLAALAHLGCGSDGITDGEGGGGSGPEECLAPNRVVGEACIEPGVQDNGCPAGTVGQPDGSCRPAGVPPELCGEGFVHDGDAACDPVLPAEPCPAGLMAIPGDTACRPVMDCGEGKWGTIPVDGNTLYVDASFAGASSDGSEGMPFTTISEALAAAPPGTLVAVAAGTYAENVAVTSAVRLWGVCPSQVEVQGQGGINTGAIGVSSQANGAEIVGFAVTTNGNDAAVAVSGVDDVTLDRLWLHDAQGIGAFIVGAVGSTFARLQNSLVENNRTGGVVVLGAEASLIGLDVRDTQPRPSDGRFGRGIQIEANPNSGAASRADIQNTRVSRNHDLGVSVLGSEVSLAGLVVRDTLPDSVTDAIGHGIGVAPAPELDTLSSATITSSLVERNHAAGINLRSATATIAGVVVRDTLPEANTMREGRGINVQAEDSLVPSTVTFTDTLVERSHALGVQISGASATLVGLAIRDTLPDASDGGRGRGLNLQADESIASTATVTGTLIERSHDLGVFVSGSTVTLDGVAVRDTFSRVSDGRFGRGMNLQASVDSGIPTAATVIGSVVERCHDGGITILSANAQLTGVAVRGVAPRLDDELFGDGITLWSLAGPATGAIANTLIEMNARAGLANFGAVVTLRDNQLACNAFDLSGENYEGAPFQFDDGGGNRCGCETETVCSAVSANLSPPDPADGVF